MENPAPNSPPTSHHRQDVDPAQYPHPGAAALASGRRGRRGVGGCVVVAAQHLRYLHVAKIGGSGVVGMLQQRAGVALLLQAAAATQGAGQQPHHAVDDRCRAMHADNIK